ncbi:MAG: hypothetical protein ACRC6N_07210, partial [Plesiomonas sp.]|uniref:hypothetical protein n=1 Tax=Plesiomonas sp. TaxID=2486279 RepID=UPI003F407666
ITNLLFYTEHTEAWHRALCSHYTHHRKRGICNGRQIIIQEEDRDSTLLTVNIYHNGTVMFQGSEAGLSSVQSHFNTIKTLKDSHEGEEGKVEGETETGSRVTTNPGEVTEAQLPPQHSTGHTARENSVPNQRTFPYKRWSWSNLRKRFSLICWS